MLALCSHQPSSALMSANFAAGRQSRGKPPGCTDAPSFGAAAILCYGSDKEHDMTGITIERVDHIGIRVRDLDCAMLFYEALGFRLLHRVTFDPVAIIRNAAGVEINLILNANAGDSAKNILMDVAEKYAGYTHVALRVASIPDTIAALKSYNIQITQGPSKFGADGGVSVFVRDPDGNVIELRGRDQGHVEGVTQYENVN
jgi:lactoylglutathione lyase